MRNFIRGTNNELVVKALCAFFGCASLFSWNALNVSSAYFVSYLFPGRDWAISVSNLNSASAAFAQICATIVGGRYDVQPRLMLGFGVLAISYTFVCLIGVFMRETATGYNLALIGIFVNGLGNGLAQSTLIGVAGLMGPKYAGSSLLGKGSASMVACVFMVLFKAVLPATESAQMWSFYMFLIITCFVCLISIPLVIPFVRAQPVAEAIRLLDLSHNRKTKKRINYSRNGDAQAPALDDEKQIQQQEADQVFIPPRPFWEIFKTGWSQVLNGFLLFICTTMIYQTVTPRWTSSGWFEPASVNPKNWFPLTIMVVYLTSDFIARFFPQWGLPLPKGSIIYIAVARFVLIPLAMVAATQPNSFIGLDICKFIIVLVLGVTGGSTMMVATKSAASYVDNPSEKEIITMAANASNSSGVFLGSWMARLMLYISDRARGLA